MKTATRCRECGKLTRSRDGVCSNCCEYGHAHDDWYGSPIQPIDNEDADAYEDGPNARRPLSDSYHGDLYRDDI